MGQVEGSKFSVQGSNERVAMRLFRIFLFFLAHPLHSVLDLSDQEVNLQRGLRLAGLKVRHHNVREHLTKVLHLGSLLFLVGLLVQFQQLTFQLAYLEEGFDDGKGDSGSTLTMQDGCQHI